MGSKVFTMVGGGAGGDIELDSITITKPPDQTAYLPGETFNPAGMTVQATYTNGATMTATGWSYSPDTGLPEGTEYVTILYSEGGITKTAQQAVTVERATVEVPTYTGSLTYTGSEQTPTFSGYDQSKMTISGDTSATNAGEYAAIFTPTAQYKWPDDTTSGKSVGWSIARAEISEPTQSGSLTYNGNSQSPVWSGYDDTQLTIGGQTSGVNAGAYTATFTPKTNYEWTDGTTAAKEVVWNIGKAVPVLTVSPTSVEVSTATPTATAAISYNGDGTLSATGNSIASASVTGTTVTITGLTTGDTTVTVNASEGTNYQAKSASISVSATMAGFATDSWETIAQHGTNGTASSVYNIGDTKDITITGVGTMTLQMADFNHDYLEGSTSAKTAGITLITKDLLPETKQMNSSDTNVGGFPASSLYDYLNDTIFPNLPEDLKSVVVPIYKWYGTGNNTTNGAWHGSKLWAPLEYELFGETTYSPATEHTTGNARKYPIFTDGASRIKKMNNGSGSANWYWISSPFASDAMAFCYGNISGGVGGIGASDSGGVCFGLCVGAPRSFATDTWEQIAAASADGTASEIYSIGDTKDIELTGIGTMTLEIADFDHDYLSGSTSANKAGISMITRDLLPNTRQMNSSNTNVGGFPASALYDYLNGTILNALPSDLRSVLKTIYKWYGTGNATTNGQWHGSKVWIPLEYEMFGTTTYSPATEHSTGNSRKYPIFTDNTSRVKKPNNGSGSANWYWEASPFASNATDFCYVGSGGSAGNGLANSSGGVCFGLSI